MTERKRRLRTGATLAILAVLALLALWCDINAGYRSISLEELGQILSGTASQSLTYTLVDLRLPRVLTSLLVGVGLSLSGCLLQGVSRNDMADPGVLGINAGAGLLVAAFIVFVPAGIFPSAVALPLLAFAGSAAVAFLGWRLSVVRGASSPRRLLLIGVALATGLSSATSLLMLRMSDGDYAFVQNWLAGSIWGASWENVAILAVGLALLCAVLERALRRRAGADASLLWIPERLRPMLHRSGGFLRRTRRLWLVWLAWAVLLAGLWFLADGQLDRVLAPWIARYGEELVRDGFPESWTILRGRLEADVALWLRLRQGVLIAGAVSGAGVLVWTLLHWKAPPPSCGGGRNMIESLRRRIRGEVYVSLYFL